MFYIKIKLCGRSEIEILIQGYQRMIQDLWLLKGIVFWGHRFHFHFFVY